MPSKKDTWEPLTVAQFCQVYGASETQVREWVSSGELTAISDDPLLLDAVSAADMMARDLIALASGKSEEVRLKILHGILDGLAENGLRIVPT